MFRKRFKRIYSSCLHRQSKWFSSTDQTPHTSPSSSSSGGSQGGGALDILGILVFGSACVGTFGLGVWQVQRYFEKIQTIEDSVKRMHEPPHPLALPSSSSSSSSSQQQDVVDALHENQGRVLLLQGTFDHSKEILLGLRSAPPNLLTAKAEGMATNPQGFYIITPFILSENKGIVFVNRGWVGRQRKDWTRPMGEVTLQVVASSCERSSTFSPVNDVLKNKTLLWLEDSALLSYSGYTMSPKDIAVVECIGEHRVN